MAAQRRLAPLLLALAFLALACAPAAPGTPTPPGSAKPEPTRPESPGQPAPTSPGPAGQPAPSPAGPTAPAKIGGASLPPGSEPAVDNARRDLAGRAGVAERDIQVRGVEEVEWPDTSLGCPRPGQMYAQVITPGFRITLEAGGRTYDYRADQQGRVLLCQR